MSKFASALCSNIQPYVAGEQPRDKQYIKLNTNENPYPPSANVAKAVSEFDTSALKLYSDPNNASLKYALSEVYGFEIDEIFVGNGSDEILAFCFPAFCESTASFADITYSFYSVYCNMFSKNLDIIPLKNDFSIDISQYFNRESDMILIANPNAPTGIALPIADIEEVVKNNLNKAVIIDEAYADFSDESALGLVKKYKNLLVVRTFSKSYSLAGARCGFAIGNRALIADLEKIKNSFNSYTVNSMTEAVAKEAISDREYFKICVEKIINTRQWVSKKLNEMNFKVLPSSANFLFVKHKDAQASDLYLKLKDKGVLVRFFNKPKINNFLRVTIGTDNEMQTLIEALTEILYGKIN